MNRNQIERRNFLKRSALVGTSLILPAGVVEAATATAPVLEGPFYPLDWPRRPSNFKVDDNADLIWVNSKTGFALGTILELSGRVLDLNGNPVRNMEVHLWQCDNYGRYHHPGDTHTTLTDNNFQGRGRTVTDGDGRYSFRTIKPVAYPGRTPHLHFKLKNTGSADLLTTQMFVAGDPRNLRDQFYLELNESQRSSVSAKLSKPEVFTLGDKSRQRVRGTFDMVIGATPRLI